MFKNILIRLSYAMWPRLVTLVRHFGAVANRRGTTQAKWFIFPRFDLNKPK
jgi:hypothetical protein